MRRPKKSNVYGGDYALMHYNDIRVRYNKDTINSSDGLVPSNMLERLKAKQGRQCSYPSVSNIHMRVSFLVKLSKQSDSCVLILS